MDKRNTVVPKIYNHCSPHVPAIPPRSPGHPLDSNRNACRHRLPTTNVCEIGSPTFPWSSRPLTRKIWRPKVISSLFQLPVTPVPHFWYSRSSREHSNVACSLDTHRNDGIFRACLGSMPMNLSRGALSSDKKKRRIKSQSYKP